MKFSFLGRMYRQSKNFSTANGEKSICIKCYPVCPSRLFCLILANFILAGLIISILLYRPATLLAQTQHSLTVINTPSLPPTLILYVAKVTEDEIHSWDMGIQLAALDPKTVTAEIVNEPTHGGLLLQEQTMAIYVPADNFAGEDTALIRAVDSAQKEALLSVTFEVSPVNDPPEPFQDIAQVQEDTPKTIDVLANDTDVDGDTLSLLTASSTHGQVAIQDNQLVYEPIVNFNGSDVITYTVTDGEATATTKVNLSVMPTQDPPYTMDDRVTAPTNSTIEIDVLKNDTDVDGDTLQVISLSDVVSGTAEIAPGGTAVYFTPEPTAVGIAQFRYEATDGNSSDNSIVSIILVARDDKVLPPEPRLFLPLIR